MPKIGDIQLAFKEKLSALYEPAELDQIIRLAFEHACKFTSADLILNRESSPDSKQIFELNRILDGLIQGLPLQYILGYAWFCDRKFVVSPSVLIPRQETEELIGWICQEYKAEDGESLAMIDLCTGSACIAISLALKYRNWKIYGLDISGTALKIAEQNNSAFSAGVEFLQGDLLDWKDDFGFQEFTMNDTTGQKKLDLIVSNPPYVGKEERNMMHSRVLMHEPELALFVEENDHLIFYREIAEFGRAALRQGGKIFVEINRKYGKEVFALFSNRNYSDVQLRKDLAGNDRMLSATWFSQV